MKKKSNFWGQLLTAILIAGMLSGGCKKDEINSTVTDIEGNVYKTITMDTQVWMAENLKTTKYNDGTTIPLVTDNSIWANLNSAGYCWYNNDAATYKDIYGALYNWDAAHSGKLCPVGWRIPTDADWTSLALYLGGTEIAGGKLKEKGTTHWQGPNTGATNETGFSALPGGYRSDMGFFFDIGDYGNWWSFTQFSPPTAYYVHMYFNYSDLSRSYFIKQSGFSIRCIRQ